MCAQLQVIVQMLLPKAAGDACANNIHVIFKDSNINIYRYRQIVVGHYVKATEGFENVKRAKSYGVLKRHMSKQDVLAKPSCE